MPIIGELEAAGVPQHVRMHLELDPRSLASTGDQVRKARCAKGNAALGCEHERRLGLLLPLKAPQRPQLIARDRMRRRRHEDCDGIREGEPVAAPSVGAA
jgi:hypothetical protein